jgi:hypothetical protein
MQEREYRESPMPPDQQLASSAMERLVVQEIGVKLTGILKENTPGRICGLLTARGRSSEWETALGQPGQPGDGAATFTGVSRTGVSESASSVWSTKLLSTKLPCVKGLR